MQVTSSIISEQSCFVCNIDVQFHLNSRMVDIVDDGARCTHRNEFDNPLV